jgi:hypothetical protein
VTGSCEHNCEPSDSIKCWEFFERLLVSHEVLHSGALVKILLGIIRVSHLNGVISNIANKKASETSFTT